MNSLPPPIPSPLISVPPVPPSIDDSNFAGPLRYDRVAIASLVCGLFVPSFPFTGLLFAPSPLNRLAILIIITPLVAFVLGILSLKRIKAEPKRLKGRGMALAGMILGAIPIGFILLLWLVFSSGSCTVCVL